MERIFLLNVGIGVLPGEGEQINLTIVDGATHREYVVPMDSENAQAVGKALLAPRVAQPDRRIQLPR